MARRVAGSFELLIAGHTLTKSYHQGRLLDHVHLRVRNLERSKIFYRAVIESLGREDAWGESETAAWADELYIDQSSTRPSRIHIAFQAADRDAVRRFHASAVRAGGTDNGPPGLRDYHGQYFAAFVLDPDGNNIEAVTDAPRRRSADSVVVERIDTI